MSKEKLITSRNDRHKSDKHSKSHSSSEKKERRRSKSKEKSSSSSSKRDKSHKERDKKRSRSRSRESKVKKSRRSASRDRERSKESSSHRRKSDSSKSRRKSSRSSRSRSRSRDKDKKRQLSYNQSIKDSDYYNDKKKLLEIAKTNLSIFLEMQNLSVQNNIKTIEAHQKQQENLLKPKTDPKSVADFVEYCKHLSKTECSEENETDISRLKQSESKSSKASSNSHDDRYAYLYTSADSQVSYFSLLKVFSSVTKKD